MSETPNKENAAYYADWGLSDENIGWLQSSGYKDASALIDGFRTTKSYVGMDKNDLIKLPKPGEDGKVDYSEVWNRMGRPEAWEGYGLPDTDFAKAIGPKLHELGITKSQADGLNAFLEEYNTNAGKAAKDARDTKNLSDQEALKKEWGADYEVNSQTVGQLVRDLATKLNFTSEDFDNMQASMGYDKAMKLMFALAGNNGVKNLTNYNSGQETPEIAAHKLRELMSDPETAKLLSKNDPKTVAEIKRLTSVSMGGK